MSSVKDTFDSAQKQVTNFAGNGYSAAQDGVHDVAVRVGRLVAIAKNLGFDDVLGAVGLQKRRGPGGNVASFGAGVAVGAGLGLLFAPMTGSDLRAKLGKSLGLQGVAEKLSRVENEVEHKLVEKKDELKANVARATDKAKEQMSAIKDKIEDKVEDKVRPDTVPNHRAS